MTLQDQVNQSIDQWTFCWTQTTDRQVTQKKKQPFISQWLRYRKIRNLSKACFRKLGEGSQAATKDEAFSQAFMTEIEPQALKLLELLLGVDPATCTDLVRGTYAQATKDFVTEAKAFDPDMESESIFQALRNVWIMHSIQVLMGDQPQHSSAIFGYSMLYPLTDNYLDRTDLAKEEKKQFNHLFRDRLEGKAPKSLSHHMSGVFDMVGHMEDAFDRKAYPEVWESILMIQTSQENSLLQQSKGTHLTKAQVMDLSFRKGGTSVLADGFLVKGSLSKEWIHFLLGYGILLQLADDLQDLFTDAADGHMTLFSRDLSPLELEAHIQRLRHFQDAVFRAFPGERNATTLALLSTIQQASDYLIYDATLNARNRCTKQFIHWMEQHFPINATQQVRLKQLWQTMIQRINPTETLGAGSVRHGTP